MSARPSSILAWIKNRCPATKPRRIEACAAAIEHLEPRQLLSTYYVDAAAGNDNNSGASTTQAWQTLAKVSGYTGFHPGDQVLLNGVFNNQPLYLGPSAAGITVSSYPGATASLTGETSDGIDVDTSGVTLSNLNISASTASSADGTGICFDNTGSAQLNGAAVNNVAESGFAWYGLYVEGNSAGFSNVNISNSSFNSNQVSGIVVGSANGEPPSYIHSNVVINNCVTDNNAGYNIATGDGAAINGGIFLFATDDATVEHCTAYHNCFNSAGGVGIWAYDSTDILFEYDQSYGNATNGTTDGGGFDFDRGVTNSIMEYNYSHDNYGAGYLLCTYNDGTSSLGNQINGCINTGNIIRYNISWDDAQDNGYGALEVYSYSGFPVVNDDFYNNTVGVGLHLSGAAYPSDVRMFGSTSSSATINYLNNLFYGSFPAGTGAKLLNVPNAAGYLKFEGNDYWAINAALVDWGGTDETTLPDWRSVADGEEMNAGTPIGLNVDPQIQAESLSDAPAESADPGLSEFKLSLASPLCNAGQNLTAAPYNSAPFNIDGVGNQDFWGDALNQDGYDIGADAATPPGSKTTLVLTWPTPAAITYGAPLSDTQLDATAGVPGDFVYTPALGTVLQAGTQTLSVTFTPTDTTDYAIATASVNLVVNPAAPPLNGGGGGDPSGGGTPNPPTVPIPVTPAPPVSPAGSLLPAIARLTAPSAIVAGANLHALAAISLNNIASSTQTGQVTINIFASTDQSLDGSDTKVATLTRRLCIKPGRKAWISLPIRSLPASLPAGTYDWLVQVLDPQGNSSVAVSTASAAVAAPFILPAVSIAAPAPAGIALNKTGSIMVTVTNTGNVPATGINITLSPSADGVILKNLQSSATILPGKSKTFKLCFKATGALLPGNYSPYLLVSLNGISITAVGTTPFTIA